MTDRKRICSFSGGRSSGMMLKMLLDRGEHPDMVVFCNTGKEREETLDFVQACADNWQVEIVWLEYDYLPDEKGIKGQPRHVHRVVDHQTAARNGEPFEKLIRAKKAVPNAVQRFCTQEMKVLTVERYLRREHGMKKAEYIELLGIRHDEPARWMKAMGEHCRVYYPLVEWGVTVADVTEFWQKQDFDLGILSSRGNCDLCFLKGGERLVDLIRERPESVEWWSAREEEVGATFRKGQSYDTLTDMALRQIPLFDLDDPRIDCYCGG